MITIKVTAEAEASPEEYSKILKYQELVCKLEQDDITEEEKADLNEELSELTPELAFSFCHNLLMNI